MPLMPIHQILPCDSSHRPIFELATVRTLFAIAELRRLAIRDTVDFVIAPRNCCVQTPFCQRNLVFAKNRML